MDAHQYQSLLAQQQEQLRAMQGIGMGVIGTGVVTSIQLPYQGTRKPDVAFKFNRVLLLLEDI